PRDGGRSRFPTDHPNSYTPADRPAGRPHGGGTGTFARRRHAQGGATTPGSRAVVGAGPPRPAPLFDRYAACLPPTHGPPPPAHALSGFTSAEQIPGGVVAGGVARRLRHFSCRLRVRPGRGH